MQNSHSLGSQKLQSLFGGFRFLPVLHFQRHVGFVKIAGIPDFAGRKHLVNGGEDHLGDGNDASLFTSFFEIRSYLVLQ